MGNVEILLDEEGQLKVAQHYDLSVVLRRVKIEGLERHRAGCCLNCSRPASSGNESTVCLRALFLGILSLAVVRFSIELYFTGGAPWSGAVSVLLWLLALVVMGVVPLAIFTGVVAVWGVDKAKLTVEKMKKMKKTKRRRKEEVKTISGLIQHV